MKCLYYTRIFGAYLNKYRKFFQFHRFRVFPTAVCFFYGILLPYAGFSLDALTQGKKLLMRNQPEQALTFLYQAVSEGTSDPKIHLYLGVCYSNLGKYTEAEEQLMEGKEKDSANEYLYLYNLGNIYFVQERFQEAEQAYTAVLSQRRSYAAAVLNRANTFIQLQKYERALNDYKFYLNLEPESSQREAIQRMVYLLEAQQREADMSRVQDDARKFAIEAEQRAAEERYRKLQEEINASLQSVDNAASLSAGSDETIDYSEDYSLE